MKEEKRALLAATLSVLVLVGWFWFFGKKNMPTNTPSTPTATTVAPNAPAAPNSEERREGVSSEKPSASGTTLAPKPETITKIETPDIEMDWTSHGGRLSGIFLKKYHQDVSAQSPPINLLPFEGEQSLLLLCDGCNTPLPENSQYQKVDSAAANTIAFEASQDGLTVRKQYDWSPDGYLFNLKVTVENQNDREFHGRLGLGWIAKQFPEKPKGNLAFLKSRLENRRSFLYKLGQDVVHLQKKDDSREVHGMIPWAGIEDRYFLTSLISRRVSSDQLLKLKHQGDMLSLSLYPTDVIIPAKGKHEETYSFYLGPKERASLTAAGVGLEDSVDYGWFGILAIPILKLLQFFHSFVKNWGLSVIILTLFAKILTNPFTIKSMKQMKEMQKLQPKLAELKERYKNDRQRLNMETMALFRMHKVNPMGGCLPMVLQMPIYIALYKVLYNAIELYHAPFFGFYKDLAAPDPYFILPILLGIAMVAQQRLTPSPSTDPTQKQMMMIMPLMFTSFMLFLPMGLVLYIFVNTLFSVIQQGMHQKDIRWRDLIKFGSKSKA